MAISTPAQSRAIPPLDSDLRWWVLKSAARCTKGVETTSKKKLFITTNSNSKSRLASSYSSQLRKSSGTRNTWRKKSQQAWFPEGAAIERPILQDPKVKQLSTDSWPCRVPNNRLLRFAGWAASLFSLVKHGECNRGSRENDAFTLLATQPTKQMLHEFFFFITTGCVTSLKPTSTVAVVLAKPYLIGV